MVNFAIAVFSSGFLCQIYKVTVETSIVETMVWSIFFVINVFFAPTGSKLFILGMAHLLSCECFLCC